MKPAALLITGLSACALLGCTDAPGAQRALESAGYTDIHIGGYAWMDCDGKSDTFATRFYALGPSGLRVKGAVCSGLFKGKTIRID